MKKRISKRVREEAAVLCAGFASTPDAYAVWDSSDVPATANASSLAVWLADKAFWTAADVLRPFDRDWNDATDVGLRCYAEAEALLRTGWVPE